MQSAETQAALRRAYDSDRENHWSPLWKGGELVSSISEEDILTGDELGLMEWFSELMAATNAEWAQRRFAYGRTPGWIIDLADRLRAILRRIFGVAADQRGLTGAERTRFLDQDFRAFLTRGMSLRRTHAAGAQFAAETATQFAATQGTLELPTALGIDIPREIANLVPKWQERPLRFSSRLDHGLYYVGAVGQTALRSRIIDSIAEQTGLTDGQVRSLARALRDRLPEIVRSQPAEGDVRVPEITPALAEKTTGVRFARPERLRLLEKKWETRGVSLFLSESDEVITLASIHIPEELRNQGMGTEFMRELIKYADQNGKVIALTPSTDFGGSSVARLKDFYQRFGFAENAGRKRDYRFRETMYREPTPGPVQFATPQKKPSDSSPTPWGAADERVRELQAKIKALEDNQAEDTEEQGRVLARELRDAKRDLAKTYGEAVAARATVTPDPIDQALAAIPAVAKMREQLAQLSAEIGAARAEGRAPDTLFEKRDALHARLEETRRDAERGLFPPPTQAEPLAFGDPNPPRNTEPPAKPVADGADEPDHLRPVRWQDMAEFSNEQLAERLERMRRLADGIAADDFESAARLKFLSSLVRETRDELDARRRDAEAEVEAAAYRSAEHAAEPATEARPSILSAEAAAKAAEADASTRAALDAEAASAIPDAPEESYPVRADAEQIGAEVSAATLESKSGLRGWLEKCWQLLRGFRSAVPELPTFKDAQRFQTFREGSA
ncbi:MAG: hypothetical protein IPL39_17995 [Opitutaceae bacterium]|nr:hypothetical protein [Opitutaceae bacterium]